MKILVTEVLKDQNRTLIHFKSNLGNGFGSWESQPEPARLQSYFVEFHVEDPLVWGENVSLAEKNVMLIKYEKDIMEIRGLVESIEEGGKYCLLRLDTDLFVFSCPDIPADTQDYISIHARKIRIYDMNL